MPHGHAQEAELGISRPIQRRRRSSSEPRFLEATFLCEGDNKKSIQRAHSYGSYLNGLPVYKARNETMGDKEKDSPPADQQLRHIPRKRNEHEDMPTVLWSRKKNTEAILSRVFVYRYN